MWDNISEVDYDELKNYYGITDADIEEAKKQYEKSNATKVMFGVSYSSWSTPIIKGSLLTTDWGQYEFSSLINEVKDDYAIPVGCGPLAAAQIMAYYRYPTNTTFGRYTINTLARFYTSSKGWTGSYNWDEIEKGSEVGRRDGSCLLYEIGKKSFTNYSSSGLVHLHSF